MPTEDQIIDQLTEYSAWLERQIGADLRPVRDGSEAPLVLLEADDGASSVGSTARKVTPGRRRWLATAAAGVVVLGGLVALGRPDRAPTAEPATATAGEADESEPIEPADEPLYALPASLDGYRVESFGNSALDQGDGPVLILGQAAATGFDRLVSVSLIDGSVDGFVPSGAQIDVGGQTGFLDVWFWNSWMSASFEQADGQWLQIAGLQDREQLALLLPSISVVGSTVTFEPVDGYTELARVAQPREVISTFVDLLPDEQLPLDIGLAIHATAGLTEDEALIFLVGTSVERTTVQGRNAFISDRPAPGSTSVWSLIWTEQTGTVLQVAATNEADARSAAEGLRFVDEETWIAELSALEQVAEPVRPVVGYPYGTIRLTTADGAAVLFEPNDAPLVFAAVDPDCAPCIGRLAELDAVLNDRVNPGAIASGTRFVAVGLDGPIAGLELSELWSRPGLTLSSNSTDSGGQQLFFEQLLTFGVLVLDGNNESVTSLTLSDEDVADQLLSVLAGFE